MAQSFEETAHLSIDQSKYRQNYDRIFGNMRKHVETVPPPVVNLEPFHKKNTTARILEARIERAIDLLQSDCHKNCSIDGIPGCKKLGCSNQALIQALRGES